MEENQLKEFLPTLNLASLIRREIIGITGKISEKEKMKKFVPSMIQEEDTLEIGFLEGKPYVIINEREAREFRTKYKQFANLVLLAVERKRGEGWLNKKYLDLGQSDQALSDIRHWTARYHEYDVEPKSIIKASEKEEKTIRLELFKPKNIRIKKSICEFKSKSESRVKKLVMKAERRMLLWERGGLEELLNKKEREQLDRESSIMRRQMALIQNAVKKMGWRLSSELWEKLCIRSEEILIKCKHKIRHI